MISEELQHLIDIALEDGVLTDKERNVINARAQKEGVDLDELSIIIDNELQKKQNSKKDDENKVINKLIKSVGNDITYGTFTNVANFDLNAINSADGLDRVLTYFEELADGYLVKHQKSYRTVLHDKYIVVLNKAKQLYPDDSRFSSRFSPQMAGARLRSYIQSHTGGKGKVMRNEDKKKKIGIAAILYIILIIVSLIIFAQFMM